MQPSILTCDPIAAPFARLRSRLLLLWLVGALLFQGLVAQTHAHATVGPIAGPARLAAVAQVGQPHGPAAPVCPLCEEKALFGAYLLAGSVTIAPPVLTVYGYAVVAALPVLALDSSSHAWRSRAPPLFTT